MGSPVELFAAIKGSVSGAVAKLIASSEGDLYVTSFLPPSARMVHSGKVFGFVEAAAVATAQAIPTTQPQTVLYNSEAPGGKSYQLLALTWHSLASATAIEDITMFCGVCQTPPRVTGPIIPVNDLATRFNLKGNVGVPGDSKSFVDLAPTLITAPTYFPVKYTVHASAVSDDGASLFADMSNYSIEIPPDGGIALAVLSTASAVTGCTGAIWLEHQYRD